MSKTVALLLAQTSPRLAEKDKNLETMASRAGEARKKDVDLLVFPELHLTGYSMKDEVYRLAEPIPGPSVDRVEKLAAEHGVHIVFGMPEESEAKGVIHNTAVLVGPEGLLGRYRKIHLPTHLMFEERRYYRPGRSAAVFETSLGRIGLTVCYDLFFPELARLESLAGAELIICISASPGPRRRFFEGFSLSRAMENAVYLTYVNRVGVEYGDQFWGGSRVVAPNGSVLVQSKYDVEDYQTGSIDLAEVARARMVIPTIKDLEPELFDQLRTKSRET